MLILISIPIILALIIFGTTKLAPWRYLYPGLVTFFFFVLLPILFTILIGFTNLGTGHLLSQKVVKQKLLDEKYLSDDSLVTRFKIYKNEHHFEVTTENNLVAFFDKGEKEPIAQFKQLDYLPRGKELRKDEIIEIRDYLKSVTFKLPGQETLHYYRTDLLAPLKNIYHETNNNFLVDTRTKEIFKPNVKTGYYESDSGKLSPGFFVFTGLSNFKSVFFDKELRRPFLKIFTWTLLWALISVSLSFSFGLLLALLVNSPLIKRKRLYRILIIIPYSIPFFISVLVFKGMLNKDFGIINSALSFFITDPIPWLEDSLWAKVSVVLVNFWLGFPYMFLVTTGILQSIPTSIYEAAKLDGASKTRTLFSITLPLIMSSVTPLLIGSFAFNMNNFVGIYLLTGGLPPMLGVSSPVGETDILISYTYRLAFEGGDGQNFGLASSISLFIFLIITIITYINFRLSQKGRS